MVIRTLKRSSSTFRFRRSRTLHWATTSVACGKLAGMLRNMFRWGRSRAVTQCSCEPEWRGLYTEIDGQRQLALPRDEMATLVGYLDLTAHCAGCGAEYPKPWGLASK
jgi:hypothetical protein